MKKDRQELGQGGEIPGRILLDPDTPPDQPRPPLPIERVILETRQPLFVERVDQMTSTKEVIASQALDSS
jgi:hypothetical protein